MDVFNKYIFSCLLVVLCIIGFSTSSKQNCVCKEGTPEGFARQSRVYFGPRLGRLKRNILEDDEEPLNRDEAALMNMIQDTPWTVIALSGKSGKRHTMNFTPRLGRKSGEDTSFTEADMIDQRSPPFAPRLGRRRVGLDYGRELFLSSNKQQK